MPTNFKSDEIDSPLKATSGRDFDFSYLSNIPLPNLSEPSLLLSELKTKQIIEKLPLYLKHRDWKMIYSTNNHGWSINTLYRQAEGYGCNVLVIKDENHFGFGGFASQTWVVSKKFYGNGECFLFS